MYGTAVIVKVFCSINTFKKSGDGSLITENKFRDQRTEQILRGFATERLGIDGGGLNLRTAQGGSA